MVNANMTNKVGEAVGRFLGAMAVGFKAALGPAQQQSPGAARPAPTDHRAYRVSLLDTDVEAVDREPLQVMAVSPENAAEKRAGTLADKLHSAGKHRNRTFRARVEWPEGAPGQTVERDVLVGVALLLKCEAIDEGKAGGTWGS
jgi:hypothetical protein